MVTITFNITASTLLNAMMLNDDNNKNVTSNHKNASYCKNKVICPINEIQKEELGNLDYHDTNPQMHLETNARLNTDPTLKINFQSF
jgi:hypothetical protein